MRVWIDLANSPHPLLFAPVARRLEQLGHEVRVTVRDNAQTAELTRERWDDLEVIGGPSPSGRAAKVAALTCRVAALARWARATRPDVALSHNSYAQLACARGLGIRAVTAMDFEFQPANHAGFRLADTVLIPEALAAAGLRRQGATPRKTLLYPGLKEEVYLGDFEPDRTVLDRVGITRAPGIAIAVVRTAPTRALYHRFGNALFDDALRVLAAQPHVRCVVLARHPEQAAAIGALRLPNVIAPRSAIDTRSLMWAADLVLGAGGTMTREAALLGVPTLTLFAGREPAVDRWLIERGLLGRLSCADQIADVRPAASRPTDLRRLRERGSTLVELFARATTASPALGPMPVMRHAAG